MSQDLKDVSGRGVSQRVQNDRELFGGRDGPLSPQGGGGGVAPGTAGRPTSRRARASGSASALQVSALRGRAGEGKPPGASWRDPTPTFPKLLLRLSPAFPTPPRFPLVFWELIS